MLVSLANIVQLLLPYRHTHTSIVPSTLQWRKVFQWNTCAFWCSWWVCLSIKLNLWRQWNARQKNWGHVFSRTQCRWSHRQLVATRWRSRSNAIVGTRKIQRFNPIYKRMRQKKLYLNVGLPPRNARIFNMLYLKFHFILNDHVYTSFKIWSLHILFLHTCFTLVFNRLSYLLYDEIVTIIITRF